VNSFLNNEQLFNVNSKKYDMKIDKIIQIIDSASILTEFGIIRFDAVLAGRDLMSTHEEFTRAVNTLSEISEKVTYNREYKGEEPISVGPSITYAELENISRLLSKAFEPENLELLREVLRSGNQQESEKATELCSRLDCSLEKLGYFFVHPDTLVSFYDKGLGIVVNTGKEIPNPRAGVVCLDKKFWHELSGIVYRYRDKKYHPDAKNMSEKAQRILNSVRERVQEQITTMNENYNSRN
jgi:hypothetical protein